MQESIARNEMLYSKMLVKLYNTSLLTSTNLVSVLKDLCATCNRTKQVKKLFQSLRSLGVNILPEVLVHKLRFKVMTVSVKVKKVRSCPVLPSIIAKAPYIRSILLSYPNRVILTAYVPENIVEEIRDIVSAGDGADVCSSGFAHDYVVRSKPLPEYLFMALEGLEPVISEESFGLCIENMLTLPEDWNKKPRITGAALNALDLLSLDPTLTIYEVRDALSERLKKDISIEKTRKIVNSASKFVYGYRVSITRAPGVSNAKLGVLIKSVSDPAKLCLSAVRHPLTISCLWNPQEVLLYISLPEVSLVKFKENFFWFIDQFGGEVCDLFEYFVDPSHMVVINMPYLRWSPLLRSWTVARNANLVLSVVEKLRNAGCVEV